MRSTFWDFVYLWSNYHIEHHYFPAVPFYQLRRLNRELTPFFEKEGIRERTYRGLLYDWFVRQPQAPHELARLRPAPPGGEPPRRLGRLIARLRHGVPAARTTGTRLRFPTPTPRRGTGARRAGRRSPMRRRPRFVPALALFVLARRRPGARAGAGRLSSPGDNQRAAVTQQIGPVKVTIDYSSPRVVS